MSAQSLELQNRLDDVETTALRHGRKIVAKLEERVRSLEGELCNYPIIWAKKYAVSNSNIFAHFSAVTQLRSVDAHKGAVKSDRKIKEMEFTTEENRKNVERMSELVDKLQGKIRTYVEIRSVCSCSEMCLQCFRFLISVTKSKLRMLKRSLPSTWRSFARHNNSWKRPRSVQKWQNLTWQD